MTEMPLKLNVLVVGAGMYVCGIGTRDYGTILPTLVQEQHRGNIGEIHVAATRPESITLLREKLNAMNRIMGIEAQIYGYPKGKGKNFSAYKQALKVIPKPAVAIISVPDHLHTSITEDVIRAGIHPLVVKPLAPYVKEVLHLIELLDNYQLYGAVEFHKRFDEANLLLRQKVQDKLLGDICYVVVEFSQQRRIRQIFDTWISKTNIFQYLGVHYADLVYFITNAKPTRVLATGQDLSSLSEEKPMQLYDAIQVLIEWEMPSNKRHFISTILTNWIDPNSTSAMSDQKINFVGMKGRCTSDQKNRGFRLVTEKSGIQDINPYFTQIYSDNENNHRVHGYGPNSILQFLRDVKNFLTGIASKEQLDTNRPSFNQALVSTAIVEAVNLSLLRKSQWIYIDKHGQLSLG